MNVILFDAFFPFVFETLGGNFILKLFEAANTNIASENMFFFVLGINEMM